MTIKNKRIIAVCIILDLICIVLISINVKAYVQEKRLKEASSIAIIRKADLKPDDFIDVSELISDINIHLRYATENNITGKVLYRDKRAFLRYGTAVKLKKANEELKRMGYTLKIWDAYRPRAVQWELWRVEPDARFIVNPRVGSVHSRGAAVDVTLVDTKGRELPMPTDFDGFGPKCDRGYKGVPKIEMENAVLLENVMTRNGFKSIYTEWWHFSDINLSNYSLVDNVLEEDINGNQFELKIQGIEDTSVDSEGFISYITGKIRNFKIKDAAANIRYGFSTLKMFIEKYTAEE